VARWWDLRDRVFQSGRDWRLPTVVPGQNQVAAREHARRTKQGVGGSGLGSVARQLRGLISAQRGYCHAEVGFARGLDSPTPALIPHSPDTAP